MPRAHTHLSALDHKSEARISKSETNSNDRITETSTNPPSIPPPIPPSYGVETLEREEEGRLARESMRQLAHLRGRDDDTR